MVYSNDGLIIYLHLLMQCRYLSTELFDCLSEKEQPKLIC